MQDRKLRERTQREIQAAVLRTVSRLHKRLDQAESRARKAEERKPSAIHASDDQGMSSGKAAASAGLLARYNMAIDALRKIGAYEDFEASNWLRERGSYSLFDESGSVQIARECLRKLKEDV